MKTHAVTRRCLWGVSLALATVAGAAEPSGSATQEPDRTKPVLELLFDGNLTDSSEAKLACTAHGTVAFVDGRRGQCMSLGRPQLGRYGVPAERTRETNSPWNAG